MRKLVVHDNPVIRNDKCLMRMHYIGCLLNWHPLKKDALLCAPALRVQELGGRSIVHNGDLKFNGSVDLHKTCNTLYRARSRGKLGAGNALSILEKSKSVHAGMHGALDTLSMLLLCHAEITKASISGYDSALAGTSLPLVRALLESSLLPIAITLGA